MKNIKKNTHNNVSTFSGIIKKIRQWCMCVLELIYKLYKKKTLHVGDHLKKSNIVCYKWNKEFHTSGVILHLSHLKIMSLNNVIDCFVCLACLKCMITRCSHPGCTKTFSEKQNWKRHEQRSHNHPFKV